MILVTGASGFVGKALLDRLATHTSLLATSRQKITNLPEGAKFIQADLGNNGDLSHALVNVKQVIHCAARVHVMNEVTSDPLSEFRRINVTGTLLLAENAAKAGVHRFIFISSIKVNGESTRTGEPFVADDKPAPTDPYALSKMEAEEGLRELSARTNMEVVIIRPPLIYGAGVRANFESMMRWLRRGMPLPLGGIKANRRSLVYIENLVDLICVCIHHPRAANQIFLVSDDEDISTATLLKRMSKALGCNTCLLPISPWIIKLGAKLIDRPNLADRLCGSLQADIFKTKKMLDWHPPFSTEEGLKRTAKAFLSSEQLK